MKNKKLIFNIVPVLCLCWLFSACNNDFLSTVKPLVLQTDTLVITDLTTDTVFQVNIPGAGNQSWKLIARPHWLKVDNMSGTFSNGKTELLTHRLPGEESNDFPVTVNPITIQVEGIGLVTIPIGYIRLGNPVIKYNNSTIKLTNNTVTQFTFSNTGGGLWLWKITQKPDWLNISQESGVVYSNNNLTLKMSIDKNKLKNGSSCIPVIISSNATEKLIILTIDPGLAEFGFTNNILRIDGDIMTTEYNKATDNLLIVTQNPNRLLFINGIDNSIRSMVANGTPTCGTFSVDGKTVYVGKTIAEIDVVDVQQQQISKTFPIDVDTKYAVYGENGWLYITTPVQNAGLRSLNLTTGKIYITSRNKISSEKAFIKKAPGRSMLFSTNPLFSPTNLYVWDISKGIARDTIDQYFMDAGNIWFTNDGNVMFLRQQTTAYYTPDFKNGQYYTSSSYLNAKGSFTINPAGLTYMEVFDHNTLTNDIWTGYNNSYSPCTIVRMNLSDLSIKANYSLKSIIDTNSGTVYNPWICWIYSSSNGKYLYGIKSTKPGYGYPVNWQIEKVVL